VDDQLNLVDSQQQAIELAKQLRSLVGEGGFKVIKWLSNSERVIESLSECDNINISLSPQGKCKWKRTRATCAVVNS
jgi:hypothetical protein